MSRTILITGATGTVSTALLDALASPDVTPRVLVRSEEKAAALRERGAEAFLGDLGDPASLTAAFDGIDDLWLLPPNGPRAPEHSMNAVWAARRAGADRVVRLSAIGAAHDAPTRSGRLHALSDHELTRSGLRWTILRPHWFMQNLFNEAAEIAATGAFSLNMGGARLGMIDVRDIAEVAARVLTDPGDRHDSRVYTLTGPRSVTFGDVAGALGQALGTPVAYNPVSDDAKNEVLLGFGVPAWITGMLTEYARAYVSGWGDLTTGAVEEITGKPPRDITEFALDHAPRFRPGGKP